MFQLASIPTTPPRHTEKEDIKKKTADLVERIGVLQDKLFAQKKYSLLVIFQGMDASGKDGAVRNVFKECHPAGIQVISFKKPTDEENAHDFLWRIHRHVPAKGMIHIFNRSHYEEVLIQRVHEWVDEKMIDQRFEAINAFESLLQTHGNTILCKFFLHISYEQQALELQERIDAPEKRWKHRDGDWTERAAWNKYMFCYEEAIQRTQAPWTIVPVDERWYRDYVIANTICAQLEQLGLQYPDISHT